MEVLLYEFKAGVNAYLASRGGTVAVHTLAEVIAWNRAHASEAMPHFAQELLERAEAKGPLTETAYLEALAACRQRARTEGLDRVFATQRVEALIAPSNGPVWATDYAKGDVYGGGNSSVAAVAGYPSVTVPTGFASALPLGLSFIGPAYSEARLLSLAYAYEQLTRARRAPTYRPTDALSNARPTPAHVPTAGDSAR
jgi:amidase